MADKLFQVKSYLSYWLDAVNEHSLHSPFFFDFYKRIVQSDSNKSGIEKIERLRRKLLLDSRQLKTKDLGSGATSNNSSIAAIAKASISPVRFSSLYSRIIAHFKAQHIIELGTSFGINTLYLAQQKNSQVTTFEGSPEIADIARLTFQFYESRNIQLIEGNIDNTLPYVLQSVRKIDFVLMDANHKYQPTVNYFEQLITKLHEVSIVVVDDIHRSHEMERAWKYLKNHKLVYGTADLFKCGILFFDPSLNKQHVILHY